MFCAFFQEQCGELLETISDRINSRHPDFISHLLLSIFKMAEVEVVQVEPSSSAGVFYIKLNLVISSVIITVLKNISFAPS